MREGPRDGRGEVLGRKQLLPELQPLGGERGGCFGHELQATGVHGNLSALLIHRGRGQVAELVAGMTRQRPAALILEQIPLQLGGEERHRHHCLSLLTPSSVGARDDGGAVAGTTAVAVAAGVALPMLAVAAVVVDCEGIGGLDEAGGGGEGRGL